MTPIDQATVLRGMVARRRPRPETNQVAPPLVAVTSGQEGVGCSTLAVHLAHALGISGQRVVLVDADPRRASVTEALLGQVPEAVLTDVLAGARGIHEILQRGPGGILVAPGPWVLGGMPELIDTFRQPLAVVLAELGEHADVVVMDAGLAGTWDGWEYPHSLRLWVTTSDGESVLSNYGAMKQAHRRGNPREPWAVVINRVDDASRSETAQHNLQHSCEKFLHRPLRCWGPLPELSSTESATTRLASWNEAGATAEACERLAAACIAQLQYAAPERLWQRAA